MVFSDIEVCDEGLSFTPDPTNSQSAGLSGAQPHSNTDENTEFVVTP